MTIFRKIYYIKIGINHPVGQARVSRPGKPNGLPEVPWGQTMHFNSGSAKKFLLRNSNRSLNQRQARTDFSKYHFPSVYL